MTHQITVYSTVSCGPCRRLKRQLRDLGVPFTEIDVDDHPEYNARIEAAAGGFRTVPTVQIGEHLLVNPTAYEVIAAAARVA